MAAMAPRRPLGALDRTFLAGETRESMMHVGVLAPFSPPDDAPKDFFRSLVEELKRRPKAHPPWTLKLRHPELLASPLQAWVEDEDFDIDYHVRRSALPCGALISLNWTPLRSSRPTARSQ